MHGIWSVCVRAAVVIAVSVFLLATSSMADDEKANTVPIVAQWSGAYSAQDAASRVVVRDTEGWKQLWRTMHDQAIGRILGAYHWDRTESADRGEGPGEGAGPG